MSISRERLTMRQKDTVPKSLFFPTTLSSCQWPFQNEATPCHKISGAAAVHCQRCGKVVQRKSAQGFRVDHHIFYDSHERKLDSLSTRKTEEFILLIQRKTHPDARIHSRKKIKSEAVQVQSDHSTKP